MHEVSRQQRIATYRFILLSVRYFSSSTIDTHTKRLFASLQKHWEPLPFIEERSFKISASQHMQKFAIPLAFWLAKPYILGEIIDDLSNLDHFPVSEITDALICLIELGASNFAQNKVKQMQLSHASCFENLWQNIEIMIACHQQPLVSIFQQIFYMPHLKLDFIKIRTLLYVIDRALDQRKTNLVYIAVQALETCEMSFDVRLRFNQRYIWALLLEKNWSRAREIFYMYPVELLNKESTLLHFLYGCWLQATEGQEIAMIHFMGLLHVTYPRSWTLASHELTDDLLQHQWLDKAFLWEKRQLYQQLSIYYHCAGNEQLSQDFFELYRQQYLNVELK